MMENGLFETENSGALDTDFKQDGIWFNIFNIKEYISLY